MNEDEFDAVVAGADTGNREDMRVEEKDEVEVEKDASLGGLGSGRVSPRSADNSRRVILGMTPWRQASKIMRASTVSSILPKHGEVQLSKCELVCRKYELRRFISLVCL